MKLFLQSKKVKYNNNNNNNNNNNKGTASPLQAWSGPEGSWKLRFPDFMTTAHEGGKVVSLTHRASLRPGNTPGTYFCQRLCRSQSHSATGRIMSLKNSNDTMGNRTRDLAFFQRSALTITPPRAPFSLQYIPKFDFSVLTLGRILNAARLSEFCRKWRYIIYSSPKMEFLGPSKALHYL